MKFTYDFGVVGGDSRQVYLANLLIEEGFHTVSYALDTEFLSEKCKIADSLRYLVEMSETIIAPIPFTKDSETISSKVEKDDLGLDKLNKFLKKEQNLYAGRIPCGLGNSCREKGVFCYDFLKNDEFTMYNAIATAEGSILEAMRNHPVNLHQSSVYVLGYGVCAKVLAEKLKGLSANVTVCARSAAARMEAKAFGYQTTDFTMLAEAIGKADFVFNTVPAKVLTREILRSLRKSAIIIDIASMPGGTDKEAVKEFGLHEEHCLSLPGIYAPKSSAVFLKDIVVCKKNRKEQ